MPSNRTATTPSTAGVAIERRYTEPGVHPFDAVEWEIRDALIGDPADPAFEQRGVESVSYTHLTLPTILLV